MKQTSNKKPRITKDDEENCFRSKLPGQEPL